mmetsp:Transcript_21397/g.31250  ORF Transcript_21397/g.31250 Transcript_21397/m.31250 type:complete len:355 (+) Transcript_21397:26-1090(+)
MDVQGNVIYLGMEWDYIENLMLGQISQVTGKEPRYPTMDLQLALAQSNDPEDLGHFIHDDEEGEPAFANAIRRMQRSQNCFPTVPETAMKMMTSTTLGEFCEGKESEEYFNVSSKVIEALGYVDSDLRLTMDHNVLSMVFEMGEMIPEAINLCATLEQLYFNFCYNKTNSFKESDGTQKDFLAVLLHVVDRVPAKEGEESFQQYLRVETNDDASRVLNDEAMAMWKETEEILRTQQALIDSMDVPQSEKDKMYLPVPPGDEGTTGPPLDKGVYEMVLLKQKGFREEQSIERRNELKDRIVRLGQICLIAHNNLQQPHGKYAALEVHFRRLFSNIKYSVNDMMTQLTDQEDLTLM